MKSSNKSQLTLEIPQLMSRLAEILRTKRKELNLSPEEIAKRIGKSARTYRYYEEDKQPRHDVLQKLAEVLQFDVSEVYEKDVEKEKATRESMPEKDIFQNVQKELGNVAKGGEMTAMFLMLIEHLQTIASGVNESLELARKTSASLNEMKEVAKDSNSLARAALLNQARDQTPDWSAEAQKRFEASLEVARSFLKQTFSHK